MAPTPSENTSATGSAEPGPLAGRKILLGVGGGIAAYKAAALCSSLVQAGALVRVAMTRAARRFVGPITFQALSGRPVITSLWQLDDHPESQHVGIARWCDAMTIAPATANIIARLAAGLCDDPVTLAASALPRSTPLIVAPAMNEQMWENPITQRNVETLRTLLKSTFVGPDAGWQACRTSGPGRMSEPQAILEAITAVLTTDRR